jgi:hypothetical protein
MRPLYFCGWLSTLSLVVSGCKSDSPSAAKSDKAAPISPGSGSASGNQPSRSGSGKPTVDADEPETASGVLDLSTKPSGNGKFILMSKHYSLTMSGQPLITAQNTMTAGGKSVPGAMALVSNGAVSADGFSYTMVADDKGFDIGNAVKEVRQGMLSAIKATVVKDEVASFGPVTGTYVRATAQQRGQEVDLHLWLGADPVARRIVGIIAIRASGDMTGVNELRDSFTAR